MEGLQKPVRGKLQEIMESTYENGDNDEWSTSISDSPTEPVVDMKWTNSLTGKSYYVQYKNTENINYIERTIQDHPNVPIVVAKGVAEKVNHPMVSDGVYGPETLKEINDEKIFDLAIDSGANECISHEEYHEIHTNVDEIYDVKKKLEKNISNFISTEIEWIPINLINITGEDKDKMIKFMEMVDDNDDVQNIFTNAKFEN